jgi:CRISPR-associated endonuclease/helicase Cas3
LIQNGRRALFSVPSIANAAFVFDEIHQYDDRMFQALLRFLDAFRGAPVLLMTASLAEVRLRAIRRLLNDGGAELEVVEGPKDLEDLRRYVLEGPVKSPPADVVSDAVKRGGKVLWVANTVDRCVNVARMCRHLDALVYHSRFRYCDRLLKHNAVVGAFKSKGAVLAVTTQVCEVSLDLSADLLITDLAPVPALIQRLGRLNRRATVEDPGEPRRAIILNLESTLPYEKKDLDDARTWLRNLGAGPQSQSDLAREFEQLGGTVDVSRVRSEWLDGGPFSSQAPLREAGATIAVIREEDRPACMSDRGRPIMKELTRHAIPMTLGPVAKEIGGWRRLGYVFVAPKDRINYSQEWGAQWARE